MPKLSLCMIVKPSKSEAKLLNRCLSYVAEHVDEICITQAGKKINPVVTKVIESYGGKQSFFAWKNDFAAARNFNFKQATGDYIFWLDADDVVKNADKLKDIVKIMDEQHVDGVVMNYLYDFDKYKRCTVKHLKTRIVRNDGCVEWAGKIHEDFKENRAVDVVKDEDVEILHLTDKQRADNSADRNLEIALETLENSPEDPRSYWLVANAYFAIGNTKAEEYYLEFIERSHSEEEKYLAYLNLAELMKNNDYALQALLLRPTYPNAYHKISEILYFHGKKDAALNFIEIGLQMPTPENSIIVYNPMDYHYNPMMLMMRIYLEIGKIEKAVTIVREMKKMFPGDKNIENKEKILKEELKEILKVDEYLEKAEKVDNFQEFFNGLPDEIKQHPKMLAVKNTKIIKEVSSGKDLVYYCGYTSKEWNPDIADKDGVGGSEEAVINLTKRWARDGWNVTVYNNCGKPGVYDGVNYEYYWAYNYRDKQDVTVFWRHPKPVDFNPNSDRIYIDLHDVLPSGEFTEERLKKIDKIFVKTEAHRILFPKVPDEKFEIIPNGVDPDLFERTECEKCKGEGVLWVATEDYEEDEILCDACEGEGYSENFFVEKNPYLILNTSSPDRHLDATLDIFEALIEREPDKPWKLAWYYGWGVYDGVHADHKEMMKWKNEQMERFDKLVQQGRAEGGYMIGHKEIAKMYMKAGVFLYPTQFYEIHCISAVKAQLGCDKVVTSDFAALKETNILGEKVHTKGEKWQTENTFGDSQIDEYINAIYKAQSISSKMRTKIADKYNWDNVSKQYEL